MASRLQIINCRYSAYAGSVSRNFFNILLKMNFNKEKEGIVKTMVLVAMVFILMFSFANTARADEIGDLKAEIQKLREDYESKIQKLQAQVEKLDKRQEERVSKIEEKVDKKVLDVEYVGRYEGPFGKGGLLIKNPSGFGNVSVGG